MSDTSPSTNTSQRKGSCLMKGLIGLGILLVVLAGAWWWYHRPIQPVELSAQEQATVAAKVQAIQAPSEPTYQKGAKEIILTERELNGLLNEKTTFGKTVSFELVKDAIHARIETDLDKNLPLVGGRHLTARARFLVQKGADVAGFVLDDVTVWGISLPNDWLAGVKGKNLLGEVLGGGTAGTIPGVEDFKVESGKLTIRLAE
jgi:hypothetical protein